MTQGDSNNGDSAKMQEVKEGDVKIKTFNLTNEEYVDYLYRNASMMREFIATHEVTSLHNLEIQTILDKSSTKDLFVDHETEVLKQDALRANLQLDYFVYQLRNTEGFDFDIEMQRLRAKIKDLEDAWKEKQQG